MSVAVKADSDPTSPGAISSDGLWQYLENDSAFIDIAVLSTDEKFISSNLTFEDIDLPFGRLDGFAEPHNESNEVVAGDLADLLDGHGSAETPVDEPRDQDAVIDVGVLSADETTSPSTELTAKTFGWLDGPEDSDGEIREIEGSRLASLPDIYTSGDPEVEDSLEYNVTIEFRGDGWTDALKEDFVAAGDYLSDIITGDITDIDLFGRAVDDIVIDASLAEIDGLGGIVGQAGPTYIRTADSLPVAGEMIFDSADAGFLDEIGLWQDVVLHEMLHTIGFGTIWDRLDLVDAYASVEQTPQGPVVDLDYRFNGAAANEAFADEFPSLDDGLGPMVESEGGLGTALGHWDEDSFGDELMTGVIDSSGAYVSDMTIASLEDLGYETIYGDDVLIG